MNGQAQNHTIGAETRFGRYVVECLLGEGGMGKVYRAHDPVLGRHVAVKAVSYDTFVDEQTRHEYTTRFTTEVRASAKLNHPSVVTVHDAGEENGTPWIAFELIDGEGLDQVIAREGRLPLERAVGIAADIASALEHAHALGIVHRDVKPSNVLIDKRSGIAKLADFGVVRTPWSRVTQEGKAVGSPGYMSPEQIDGSELDGRSDVFALSIVLYEMLTGKHPFMRETIQGTCFATVSGAYEPLQALAPDTPDTLHRLIAAGLTPRLEERLGSAREMVQVLREVQLSFAPGGADRDTVAHRTDASSDVAQSHAGLWWRMASRAARLAHRTTVEIYRFGIHLCGFSRTCRHTSPGAYLGTHTRTGIVTVCRWCRTAFVQGMRVLGDPKVRSFVVRHWRGMLGSALIVCLLVVAMIARVRALRRRVIEASTAEALAAAETLRRYPFVEGFELVLTKAEWCIASGEMDSARVLLTGVLSIDGIALRAHVQLAWLERLADDRKRSDELLVAAGSIPNAAQEYRSHERQLREGFEQLFRQGICSEGIELIAGKLDAANSRSVDQWMENPHYWLRWNAVRIRGNAGLPVDSVEVYALDLAHAGSVRTRARAARKLGEFGDSRAIPALRAAREKGVRDPVVAAAASSALELLGVED